MDNKGAILIVLVSCMLCFELSSAGPFSRGTQGALSSQQGSAPVNPGGNYHGLSNANGNVGFQRRASYLSGQAGTQQTVSPSVHKDAPNMRLRPAGAAGGSGLTAWGIITVIVAVIILGFCGYYGIICYPLFFEQGSRYDVMDVSTTTTTSSPTRSPDFGKIDYEEEEYRGYPKLSNEKAQWGAGN